MRKLKGKAALFGAAGAIMLSGVAAEARAACWTPREADAAQVREMQTALMVAALRCRAAGMDIAVAYDGFVGAQRDRLAAANLIIKTHFARQGGSQADYDRFTTALANGHGDEETTRATCDEAASLARQAAASADDGPLRALATERVFPATLPDGACDGPAITPAVARPTPAALPPIVFAAAPPADAPPVTLPADVVAALIVMARYRAAAPLSAAAPVTQVAAVATR